MSLRDCLFGFCKCSWTTTFIRKRFSSLFILSMKGVCPSLGSRCSPTGIETHSSDVVPGLHWLTPFFKGLFLNALYSWGPKTTGTVCDQIKRWQNRSQQMSNNNAYMLSVNRMCGYCVKSTKGHVHSSPNNWICPPSLVLPLPSAFGWLSLSVMLHLVQNVIHSIITLSAASSVLP